MSENKVKVEYKIEEWGTIMTDPDPYLPPEAQIFRLNGKITGHPNPRVTPSNFSTTSEIVRLDIENGRIETRNSIYLLGAVAANFVTECQRSKATRTLAALKAGGFIE